MAETTARESGEAWVCIGEGKEVGFVEETGFWVEGLDRIAEQTHCGETQRWCFWASLDVEEDDGYADILFSFLDF